jgi:(2R)-3-sulfolactate dehydrogenase (NADP+)
VICDLDKGPQGFQSEHVQFSLCFSQKYCVALKLANGASVWKQGGAAMRMTLDEVEALALRALTAAGASAAQAGPVARSIRAAERDGMRSHGILYLPVYAEHLACGKVDGQARPQVSRPRAGAVVVDAARGFAHPAIDAGMPALIGAAREVGIAAMTLRRSYNCGLLGHHAERLAEAGLIGLCFTHAPAPISPVGGKVPVIGTNPFGLAREKWRAPTEEPGGVLWETGTDRRRSFGVKRYGWR